MDFVGWSDVFRSALRFLGKARGTHHLAADPLRLVSFVARRKRHRRRRMAELGVPVPEHLEHAGVGLGRDQQPLVGDAREIDAQPAAKLEARLWNPVANGFF